MESPQLLNERSCQHSGLCDGTARENQENWRGDLRKCLRGVRGVDGFAIRRTANSLESPLIILGVILALLGMAGHAVGGRRHYF